MWGAQREDENFIKAEKGMAPLLMMTEITNFKKLHLLLNLLLSP